jgi:transcriptional regulator
MYVPSYFAEADRAKLHAFIEANSFGLLISTVNDEPFASHLPFLLERDSGPNGKLVGHMARANSQWQELDGQTALAIFSGAHAYISPTWYEAEHVVPTWNYTAVHVYGKVRVIHDGDALLKTVQDSVAFYEAALPQPWKIPADDVFLDRLLKQIVGFRIEIQRLEGKFKLNQNHPPERREKVIRALSEQGGENSLGVAELMRQLTSGAEEQKS